MTDKLYKRRVFPNDNQALTMEEVLKGLEDIANLLTYDPWPGDFEIVAIIPEGQSSTTRRERIIVQTQKPTLAPRPSAKIISLEERRKQYS